MMIRSTTSRTAEERSANILNTEATNHNGMCCGDVTADLSKSKPSHNEICKSELSATVIHDTFESIGSNCDTIITTFNPTEKKYRCRLFVTINSGYQTIT